jgi:hypothetical protein
MNLFHDLDQIYKSKSKVFNVTLFKILNEKLLCIQLVFDSRNKIFIVK